MTCRFCSLLLLVTFVFLGLSGCTLFRENARSVHPVEMEAGAYSEINEEVGDNPARIITVDGEVYEGYALQLTPETSSWIDPGNNQFMQVPTTNIHEVSLIKTKKGALAGLAIGMVTGTVYGLLRALAEGSDEPDAPLSTSLNKKLVIYPVALSIYASLVTIPAGAVIGRRDRYRFEDNTLSDTGAGTGDNFSTQSSESGQDQ